MLGAGSTEEGRGGSMKSGLVYEIDWELVGASLARESDNEQVAFFKGFIEE